ncbi:uncharacterized protein DSM5745_03081 [Aspergillus mulundensis]|uniref:Ankyrin repeat protein n=1 Tax=Aspergillus mulundensis TaxID=1810919 RepID=A0A3D8SJC2_9EURO|nr:hypothetical protein DSM5745_03081 [Aspergillus mulundensis]RDW86439.1 hypothetical protein DSM5745_03081 [Aspergillus mulundensis]
MKLLLESSDGFEADISTLLFAIKQGNADIVQLLLEHRNEQGVGREIFLDALLYGARLRRLNIVRLLLGQPDGAYIEPSIHAEYAARTASREHDEISDLLLHRSLELDID